jgi:hypothetical protein
MHIVASGSAGKALRLAIAGDQRKLHSFRAQSLQQFRAGLRLGQAENAVLISSRESRVVRLI